MKISLIFIVISITLTAIVAGQSQPSVGNTGWSGTLTDGSSGNISTAGTIIENKEIRGTLTFLDGADNCIIRNCKISTGGAYAINVKGAKNLVIENCELSGMTSAAILGSNWSLYRSIVHNSGADGLKPVSNVHIEGNLIYNCGYRSDSHADGIQMVGGSNVTIINNYFDMGKSSGYNNSANLMIQTNNIVIDNLRIEGNWFKGGAYTVNINDKKRGYGPPTNVLFIDNIFYRESQYGPWVFGGATDTSLTRYGNRWEDTNELLDHQKDGPADDSTLASPSSLKASAK